MISCPIRRVLLNTLKQRQGSKSSYSSSITNNIILANKKNLLPRVLLEDGGRRNFWGSLNGVFNRYDKSRVREVGGDRACAEWLLRNGAAIKYENSDEWLKDYNILPPINVRPKIVEVDATDSSISHAGNGFKHFEHTKHIRRLKLHKCNYLYDDALYHLPMLSFSLKDLQISSCPNISDDGILALSNMKDLEKLYMYDLLGVKDRKKCLEVLQNYLKQCSIDFPWAQESEKPVPPKDETETN